MSSTTAVICGLGDADLDATTGERRVDRVVVAINPDERLRRHPDHLAAVDVRHPRWQRSHPSLLLDEPLGRDRANRPMHPPVGLLGPRVEPVLEVEMVREHPARLEVRAHEPVRALQQRPSPADRAPRGSPSRPPAARRTRRTPRSGGRPRRSLDSRSQTNFSGNAPSRPRFRASPSRMSGASLLKTSVPAIARDQHTSQVTTQPRRG